MYTQTKGKTYKRIQTGFKLLLPSLAMDNVYRVFRQLFDVLPRYISCLKCQERYPQICKDLKKIYCPVPFKRRNLEKFSRLSSKDEVLRVEKPW